MKKLLLSAFEAFAPNYFFLKRKYFVKTGQPLDLSNPTKFSEKIQWLKAFYRNDLLVICTDKFKVREYVVRVGLGKYLVELYLQIDHLSQLSLSNLPNSFVAKANHTSGSVLLVEDKSKLSLSSINELLRDWLSLKYWHANREWAYKNIKPCIIFEEFLMESDKRPLLDYKIHCFHGRANFVELMSGRGSTVGVREKLYDREWNELPFQFSYPDSCIDHARPDNLSELIMVAEKLAAPFPYVRVDLYLIYSCIYFGELTFYPHSGWDMYYLREYPWLDDMLGDLLDLSSVKLK